MRVRNKTKSASEWQSVIKSCESSGMSIENYCKESNVSLTAYYKNRNRLKSNKEVKFLEVNVDKEVKNEVPKNKLLLELRFRNCELIFNIGGC